MVMGVVMERLGDDVGLRWEEMWEIMVAYLSTCVMTHYVCVESRHILPLTFYPKLLVSFRPPCPLSSSHPSLDQVGERPVDGRAQRLDIFPVVDCRERPLNDAFRREIKFLRVVSTG